MIFFYVPAVSVLIIALIFIIVSNSKSHIFTENISPHARKIHTHRIIRVGSLSLLSFLLLYYDLKDDNLRAIILFSFFVFLIGFAEDLLSRLNHVIRLIVLFFFVLYFVIDNNFIIENFDNVYLDLLINHSFLSSIVFILLGYLILINGFNFIDGINGLMLGVAIIILLHFLYFTNESHNEVRLFIILLILSILPLFFINLIWGTILAGDGGSYFIGSIIGSISIYIANLGILSPAYVACIIFYPVMEVFLSFTRRLLINNKNPLLPDEFHLHTMTYRIIEKKININNIYISLNSFSSLILIMSFLIINLIMMIFKNYINFEMFFFFLCFLYLFIYFTIYFSYIKEHKDD